MTTQATHTPGPWKEKRKLAIYSADDEPICAVFPAETEGQSAADARLIAAAPDLLEALKVTVWSLFKHQPPRAPQDPSTDASHALAIASAAIAKAEGRAE
jgi:hypothetical protein